MKRLMFVILVITVSVAVSAQTSEKKYGIKSGIVESRISVFGIKTTVVTTFDDYGDKLSFQMNEKGVRKRGYCLAELGKFIISVDLNEKKVSIEKTSDDLNIRTLSDADKIKYRFKEEGTELILGKECNKYSWNKDGEKFTVWMWEGISLKSVTRKNGLVIRMEATSIKENQIIDPSVFELPDFAVAEVEKYRVNN